MKELSLDYATNRKLEGSDRWNSTSYGKNFSDNGGGESAVRKVVHSYYLTMTGISTNNIGVRKNPLS